jgi:predicted dehydrogenase
MAKAIRIGVIGCGFYAQNHLHAWKELATDGAVLAAVCDVDAGKAGAAGRAFGVPFYTDAATLLASEKLDAVDIVTR